LVWGAAGSGAYPWDIYRINGGMVKELLGISDKSRVILENFLRSLQLLILLGDGLQNAKINSIDGQNTSRCSHEE
jgi:hypothetical protein